MILNTSKNSIFNLFITIKLQLFTKYYFQFSVTLSELSFDSSTYVEKNPLSKTNFLALHKRELGS